MPAARKRPSAPKRRRPPTPRSAQPAALDRGAARQVAAALVGNVWAQSQAAAAENRQELADWWAKVVEEEKAAYLDETGQPLAFLATEHEEECWQSLALFEPLNRSS